VSYVAPLDHLRFLIHVLGRSSSRSDADLVDAVLESAGRFAQQVLAPLNATGDRLGAEWSPLGVRAPEGFREAYERFASDGWPSLSAPAVYGGQDLPQIVVTAVGELWASANLAFALCAEASIGAIEALIHHAAPELRDRYVAKLVSGDWTSTMCLSEPSAGSDLSTVATRAVPHGDGYRLFGRKIYITWGEHDLSANTLHLVLARLPAAPDGAGGLSLFLVPRFLPGADGSSTVANDIHAVSIERKMGLHASPTCVMALGDRAGADGYLIGTPHRGLACMFTMMNVMRLGVALQGGAAAERAYQLALAYAKERHQGRDPAGRQTAIVNHADVRRMLLTMRVLARASRALTLTAAAVLDARRAASTNDVQQQLQARADLLTPVAKAWCSEAGIEAAALGIQVHGGMGYVEDSGAAQIYRDVRVTSIFEGTNYIQAQDLLSRKVLKDNGRALRLLFADYAHLYTEGSLPKPVCAALEDGRALLDAITVWVNEEAGKDPLLVGATAVNYLMLLGYVLGAHLCAQAAAAATAAEAQGIIGAALAREVQEDAEFFVAYLLPRARMHGEMVRAGSELLARINPAEL